MATISADGNDWKSGNLSMREVPSRDMLVKQIAVLETENATLRDQLRRANQCVDALERDRALLLAYIKADEDLWSLTGPDLRESEERGIETRFNTARQALIDAGLLESDE